MKYYRLVFNSSDRKDSSDYGNPRYRIQLPAVSFKDNKNKNVRVILESFSGFFDSTTTDVDFSLRINLKNQRAFNVIETSGTDTYESSNLIEMINYNFDGYGAGNNDIYYYFENKCDYNNLDYGYRCSSSLFDNGTIEFEFSYINDIIGTQPNDANLRYYSMVLGLYLD